MKKLKRVSAFVIAGMTLVSASDSGHALGFGRPFSRAVLGDTLLVTIPLRLEAGEEISDECLAADVFFGEDKVLASAVKTAVQPGEGEARVLKVSTTAIVNEPVVTVYLAAGCKARMTRKFVAFADPPGIVMPSTGETTPANLAVIDERADDKAARRASSTSSRSSSRGSSASAKTARAGASAARQTASGDEVAGASGAAVMSGRSARVLPTPESEGAAESRSSLRAASSLAPERTGEGNGGRLVLDNVPTDLVSLHDLRMSSSLGVMIQADDQSPEVLARRRTAAALWRALNATPEEMARDRQRLVELEQRLTQLTVENKGARQALAEAQGVGGTGKWLALLALIALAAVGVAVYLARKLKSSAKGQDAWWHSQTDSRLKEPNSEAPADAERTSAFVRPSSPVGAEAPVRSRVEPGGAAPVTASAKATPGRAGAPTTSSALPPAPSVLAPVASKQALHELVPDAPSVSALATSAPAVLASRSAEPLREVSVEELIDLEQQAEFFVVLGQDDAAIGLLESHVTNTTGASPLPFLKLLEIYRRLGRRSDYDLVQSQFNLRFNAHAPAWESDLQQGHSLDEYPGVVERLQALWATPAKAMEVLEKSLTRPDASADTFELPAYRELLFLYAVARDLSEREPHERANVDLLLPSLDGMDDGEPTMPSAGSELEDSGEPLMATRPIKAQPEALPSMNLDFHLDDLSEPSDMTKH